MVGMVVACLDPQVKRNVRWNVSDPFTERLRQEVRCATL